MHVIVEHGETDEKKTNQTQTKSSFWLKVTQQKFI